MENYEVLGTIGEGCAGANPPHVLLQGEHHAK